MLILDLKSLGNCKGTHLGFGTDRVGSRDKNFRHSLDVTKTAVTCVLVYDEFPSGEDIHMVTQLQQEVGLNVSMIGQGSVVKFF